MEQPHSWEWFGPSALLLLLAAVFGGGLILTLQSYTEIVAAPIGDIWWNMGLGLIVTVMALIVVAGLLSPRTR